MKKVVTFLAVFCLLMNLAACSGNQDPVKTEPQNNETQATTPVGDPNAFYFTYEGTEIRLHADMAPILEKLGEPKKYNESASCAFEGLDKSYYYGSFYLETYPQGDKDFVSGWWFADDSVTTPEGIYIGSSKAEVEKAYGTDGYNGTNAYTVNKDAGMLTIILENDVVTSIQYGVLTD